METSYSFGIFSSALRIGIASYNSIASNISLPSFFDVQPATAFFFGIFCPHSVLYLEDNSLVVAVRIFLAIHQFRSLDSVSLTNVRSITDFTSHLRKVLIPRVSARRLSDMQMIQVICRLLILFRITPIFGPSVKIVTCYN